MRGKGVNWKKTELSSSALGEEFKSFGYCNYKAEGRRGEARGGSLGGPNLDNIRAERIASGIIRNIVPFCRGPKWGLMGNYECKISCFINFDAVSAANKHSACHKSRMASFNFRIGASFMCGKISTRSIKGQGKGSRERGLGITTHTARTTCNFSN